MLDLDAEEGSISAYEIVSQDALYEALNRELVAFVHVPNNAQVVDLGCGSGSLSRIVLDRVGDASVWAVDPDPDMVAAASKTIGARAGVLQAGGEDFGLRFPAGSMDLVLMGNALHLVDDIPKALAQVHRVLRPGGVFAFNTAFHEGAFDSKDRGLAWELVLEAHRIVRRTAPDLVRKAGGRPLAKRALTRAYYEDALRTSNFVGATMVARGYVLPPALVIKILSTPVFAEGALPGVPPELAARTVGEAATIVMARASAQVGSGIKRSWLYCAARKEA